MLTTLSPLPPVKPFYNAVRGATARICYSQPCLSLAAQSAAARGCPSQVSSSSAPVKQVKHANTVLTLSIGAHARFDAQNTVLQEVLQREVRECDLPAIKARLLRMDELMAVPCDEAFSSDNDAWFDAKALLFHLHRHPSGMFPGGPLSLLSIVLALHDIRSTALAAKSIRRAAPPSPPALSFLQYSFYFCF